MNRVFLLIALIFAQGASEAAPRLKCEKKWGEMSWEGMTFKRYRLRADDFPSEKQFRLVVKSFDGSQTQMFTYRANRKGHLILQPGERVEKDVYAICPVKRGEKLTFLMQSEDQKQGIQAHVVPFPIEVRTKKGVSLALELAGEKGERFLFIGKGFNPCEAVGISCHYGSNVMGLDAKVNNNGEIRAWITLPVDEGGSARLILRLSQEEVVLPFEWGAPALKLIGACCLEVK